MGSGSRRRIHREYRWVLSTPSAWPGLDLAAVGLSDPESTDIGDLLADAVQLARGESFLAFQLYTRLTQMHTLRVVPLIPADPCGSASIAPATRAFEELAAMLAASFGWGDRKAQGLLNEAVDLITRLPDVAQRLRDGVITVEVARKIVERTSLISDGPMGGWLPTEPADGQTQPGAIMARVDAAIADELDKGGRGAWTPHLARDMADRIVFREEPDAVRERRRTAKLDRRAWTTNLDDDMAMLGVTMSAERVQVSIATIRDLAARVCANDPRTTPQRNSDVMFCLINQVPYRCECADPATCTSDLPAEGADPAAVVPVAARTILHVVADEATVAGHADSPGYLSGHGVISADHVRDIAADPTTILRPLAHTYCSLDDVLAWINASLTDTDTEHADQPESESESESDTQVADPSEPEPGLGSHSGAHDGGSGAGAGPRSPEPRLGRSIDHLFRRLWGQAPGQILPLSARLFVPATQPANPYKPSTVLDTFIRIRDCYSLFPGNPHSAFGCDLDHATEYNHDDPATGGQTEPGNLGAKDRYAHNRKTHGNWTDDLHTTSDGHVTPVYITPDGIVIEGRAGPGLDLFPGLARYTFLPTAPITPPKTRYTSSTRSRRHFTLRKHRLRQAERDRNRAARLAHTTHPDPAGTHSRLASQDNDDADPPY